MKRLLIIAAALTLVGGTAVAGVAGTGHDLTGGGTFNSGSDELCVHCHTPHNSTIAVPLWNHTLSSATNYTYYTSDTLDLGGTDQDASLGITAMCMSCHDGTVAMNSLINPLQDTASNPTNTGTMPAGLGLMGVDLRNDHPVGFAYTDASLTDPDIPDAFTPANGVLLFSGRVECASCHDPHNSTAEQQPFLVAANTASVICTTCHSK